MSTEEETSVDQLICEYDAHRSKYPKLGLPEISANNRKFLIDSAVGTAGRFKPLEALIPDESCVFLGAWNGRDFSRDGSLRNTVWFKCQLQGDCSNINFSGAIFINCELANIQFFRSKIKDVTFENCTFIREKMSGAFYENVKIITPKFKYYEPINDDLDQVILGTKSKIFDWSKLRILSEIPMFSISWSILLGSLAIMNIVGWGSSNRDKLSSLVEPLSMPPTLIELFAAALLLAVAATLYAVACPSRIKEISETEWTDKNNKPRFQYYSSRFPYRWRERIAIVMIYIFGAFGLLLSGKLITERVLSAYCFTINWEAPEQCEAPLAVH